MACAGNFLVNLLAWETVFQQFLEQIVQNYGLLGLFIAAIISNATILFPVPLDIFIFIVGGLAGNAFDVLLIGIVSGVGAAIGEMTAYIIGLLGIGAAERAKHKEFKHIKEVRRKLRDFGMVFIALGAMTPFPFDLVGIAAGIIKYSPRRFFAAALAGKLARYTIIAFAGFYGLGAVRAYFMF